MILSKSFSSVLLIKRFTHKNRMRKRLSPHPENTYLCKPRLYRLASNIIRSSSNVLHSPFQTTRFPLMITSLISFPLAAYTRCDNTSSAGCKCGLLDGSIVMKSAHFQSQVSLFVSSQLLQQLP